MAYNLWTALRRTAIGALCALGATALFDAGATAQTYPSKNITIVVPSPPGGGPDIWGRILADKLQARLGQTVIVENKTGAGGLTGAVAVARAPADGHTLLVSANTLGTASHIFKDGSGGLNINKELLPFINIGLSPAVIVVNADLGVKTLKDLVALAKTKPLTYGSSGTGTLLHMAGELFNQSAGIKLTHVPFRGFAQATTELLAGRVDVLFTGYSAVKQHVTEGGKLVLLGMITEDRFALAPKVPTIKEQGFKNVDAIGWYGVYAPAATPAAVIKKLNEEVNAILKMPDVQERAKALGLQIVGGSVESAHALYNRDDQVFGKVIKEAGIGQN